MKITSVDLIALERDPGCLSRPVLCRVFTDDGLYGIGEAGVAIGTGAPAAFAQMKDIVPMLLGADPLENEVLWEKMFRQSFWAQGNGAIVMAAISALDIALWDIKAKAANLPLYKLLGGKHRNRLRCYASQLQFGWGVDSFNPQKGASGEPAYYAEMAQKAAAEGYTAVKVNFMRFNKNGALLPYTAAITHLEKDFLRLVEARIRAVRDAVGPDVEIIMENHAMTSAGTAVQIANIAEPYGIMFFEEPALALNPAVMRKIAERTTIPLATGERTYTRWGFLPFLENNSLQIIQPDIGNCGGITEAKKICDMAHIYDVGVQAHVCSSPVSVAVALHLEAALSNFVIHEHHLCNTLTSTIVECVHDYQPKNGYFEVPEIPGHGNDVHESVLRGAYIETVK
ncbi:MAG: mandelate racemase/muconate lactonizing enzyme family protein [Spirochaetaceae bacterium]|jgi:L-alanine-DL-glutamate epimerase-like enolase superfamily enzyme|nr:mandelate racemase/muconate lactonizing enzyme family protein [Spirochaetaceae bacterium]